MKNFMKLMGAIAMVAVIGFSMAACGGRGGAGGGSGGGTVGSVENTVGQLTITGIPAAYYGKYIYGSDSTAIKLAAFASVAPPDVLNLAQISNTGEATLKVWRLDASTASYRNYNGNDSVQFMLGICDLPTAAENNKKPKGGVIAIPAGGALISVIFSSGIGSAAVSSWDLN